MPSTRNRYQEGSLEKVSRAKGPDVWVYRWRELQPDGSRKQRKRVIGDVIRLKTLKDVKREVENFRAQLNAAMEKVGRMTIAEAWGHFQEHELYDPDVDRSPTTVANYLDYFKNQILPNWKDTALEDVKSVAVEKWLRTLDLAPGTKAKIRNHMSALFSHCIRHELYTKLNPVAAVRQGAVRQREPDVLTIPEFQAMLGFIVPPAIRIMVLVAAASALRRSEIRGLKWEDLDFTKLWFNLKRGEVRKFQTKMKSHASRKGVPMLAELAEVLQEWRRTSLYPLDADWVFASPFTHGMRPYWPESALNDHIRPAVERAGINKSVGWHTFRHTVGTELGDQGMDVKVVQELLRHANSRITIDVYQHSNTEAKRTALSHLSGIFVVAPRAS